MTDRPPKGSQASNHTKPSDYFAGAQLGDIVQALYAVPKSDIQEALAEQAASGGRLGDILVERGIISPQQLSASLSVLVKRETTFLSHAFLSPLKNQWWGRHLQLAIESLLVALFSLGIVHGLLRLEESGLIAIFLFSSALTTRFNAVLADVNLKSEAIDILAIFLGVLIAFSLVAIGSSPEGIQQLFGFVIRIAAIDPTSTLHTREFSNVTGIFINNCYVLFSVFILSFLYRAFATILILSWQACVWGIALTMLVKQSLVSTTLNPALYSALAGAGILPHLTTEALGYICCSVAGIGFSKAYLWHGFMTPRFVSEVKRHVLVVLIALVTVLVSALLESNWAPFVFGKILALDGSHL